MDITLVNFDKYLDHTRSDAYNLFRNEKNLKTLRRFFLFAIFIFGMITLISFSEEPGSVSPFLYLSFTIVILFLRIFYKKIFNLQNIRRYLFYVLIAFLLAITSAGIVSQLFSKPDGEEEVKKALVQKADKQNQGGLTINVGDKKSNDMISTILFVCIILIFFRLSKNEIIQLYTLTFGIPILTELIIFNNFSIGDKIGSLVMVLMFFIISYTGENNRQKKFFKQFVFY
jgi:hypothetical protein